MPDRWWRIAMGLVLFGISFGYVEAAVVVYIRTIYEPIRLQINPRLAAADLFPLMTLQQLRTVCEIVANAYSVSRAAIAMHASQSAVSKVLGTFERELGTEVFLRSKGRIIGLTEFGASIHGIAKRMLKNNGVVTQSFCFCRADVF